MDVLYKYQLFKSVSEKMDQQLKLLIKLAIEVIQSLVIHVPPLVVDCFPHPDINSGAYNYSRKKVFVVENYITTQSALFYSYKGELPAKKGELSSKSSISNDIFAQFGHDFRSEHEIQFHTEEKSSSQKDQILKQPTRNRFADGVQIIPDNESSVRKFFPCIWCYT